jgi:hypothetical protein
MARKLCLLANAALCLWAVCFSVSFAGKPDGNDPLPAKAVLRNDTGDNIRSDAVSSTYENGKDGARVVVFDQTGDLVLITDYTRVKQPRKLLFSFPAADWVDGCIQTPNTAFQGTSIEGRHLVVDQVLSVTDTVNWVPRAAGSVLKVASLHFGSGCSGWVWVKALPFAGPTPVAWIISSDRNHTSSASTGELRQALNGNSGNGGSGTQAVAEFRMPFSIGLELILP